MKLCSKCNTEKDLTEFYKSRTNADGLEGRCKSCKSAYRKAQYQKNRTQERAKNEAWKAANPERYAEICREHYKANKEWHNAFMQKHYRENKPMYRAKDARYRAAKLNATPPWLTEKQLLDMQRIYTACSNVTERTRKPHHVDHIVPLQGENVCGLHVPWNLAILPASMNLAKSNTH